MIMYLQNTSETKVRFDDYYSFYFLKENFQNSVTDFYKTLLVNVAGLDKDRAICCGNYLGCCYYVNPICYVHDTMCSDCRPSWFCLRGCKSDKPVKNVNSLNIN